MPLYISTSDIGLSPHLRKQLAALGISVDSFDELLLLLVDQVTTPSVSPELPTAETMLAGARTFGLGGGSSQAAKLSERTFSYTTSDQAISYDLTPIINALPAGISHISSSIAVTGNGRAASRASSGSIVLPENASQAKVDIHLQTEHGILVMTKTFPVGKNQSGAVTLTVDDQSASPSNLTVAGNLEMVNQKLAELEVLVRK